MKKNKALMLILSIVAHSMSMMAMDGGDAYQDWLQTHGNIVDGDDAQRQEKAYEATHSDSGNDGGVTDSGRTTPGDDSSTTTQTITEQTGTIITVDYAAEEKKAAEALQNFYREIGDIKKYSELSPEQQTEFGEKLMDLVQKKIVKVMKSEFSVPSVKLQNKVREVMFKPNGQDYIADMFNMIIQYNVEGLTAGIFFDRFQIPADPSRRFDTFVNNFLRKDLTIYPQVQRIERQALENDMERARWMAGGSVLLIIIIVVIIGIMEQKKSDHA